MPNLLDREIGIVKWFSAPKGYGFIKREKSDEKSGEDVFVHYSAIRSDGYRTLREGQKVEYSLAKGKNGLQAEEVEAIDG